MVSRADGIMKTMESKIETSGTHATQPWPEKNISKRLDGGEVGGEVLLSKFTPHICLMQLSMVDNGC